MNDREQQLWQSFFGSLAPEVQKDLNHYLSLYDWFLDEEDPAERERIVEQLKHYESKYNLTLDHTKKAAQ